MKKRLVITGFVILAIALGGYFAVRIGVGYVFDKYIIKSALSSIAIESVTEPAQEQAVQDGHEKTEEKNVETGNQEEPSDKPRLSKSEIISKVLKNAELTNKMASMVAHEDKNRVVKIILSNFSANEIAEIAKAVSKGITPEFKSKMINEARSRLTTTQWQQCMDIAYKYIEKIRPFVE